MIEAATIVGVATGSADGGVAIIRLSGPRARAIVVDLVGELPAPRMLGRRRVRLAVSVEDALVVDMPGPRSFTGEDVVELHVHGGARNVQEIVDHLLVCGAVAAGPGEFSRRAFENGRLSLDQAEGIAALIAARTQEAVDQARRLVAGELADEVEALRGQIEDLRVEIEANLDFPEDVDAADEARWLRTMDELLAPLERWLARFEAGRRARERARVVLAGPPNAGKSSLFNALLGRARAIVAAEPGTTRDYVEAELELGRHGVVLVDTAGIRGAGAGAIEEAGIVRSREQLAGADLILWIEAADAAASEEMPEEIPGATLIRIESKRDLGARRVEWLGVSARGGADDPGLEALRAAISRWIASDQEHPWIGLARHRERAAEAHEALAEAASLARAGAPLEVIAFQIGIAERRLAEISGRAALGAVGAEVLDRIFSRFCIGK
ncbi:MAG: tRNA uridine-5-carboxymethylaminomethyl(34) synthesis GTPase MnmE [Myxococcales bacterium]|nr:tRNA uridine-5-carboxymethylaminomethyl(34) synthesis GTPase MnmE [Myxococcales bacterium]